MVGFFAALFAPIVSVVGAIFTLGCMIFGGKSLQHMTTNHAEAKATEHWNKNSCSMVFSTASGGRKLHGYSYEATGVDLDCKDMPKRAFIEKKVKHCVRKYKNDSIAAGCCDKTIGKAHWQIRISKDKKLHPIANIHC